MKSHGVLGVDIQCFLSKIFSRKAHNLEVAAAFKEMRIIQLSNILPLHTSQHKQ